ncbi:MAG TPA: helix-turn-helix domain-containing protein [Terriglobales bacterium]|nr:helix-turn-helix domain-containing protein [Terriglobales bacterium]
MVALATRPVAELRRTLGISQAALARLAGVSRHTIIRAEHGRTLPSPLVQAAFARVAQRFLPRTEEMVNVPIHRLNMRRMDECLGKPGPEWKYMNGQQRACYYSHRARYQKILAEFQAGRALMLPR